MCEAQTCESGDSNRPTVNLGLFPFDDIPKEPEITESVENYNISVFGALKEHMENEKNKTDKIAMEVTAESRWVLEKRDMEEKLQIASIKMENNDKNINLLKADAAELKQTIEKFKKTFESVQNAHRDFGELQMLVQKETFEYFEKLDKDNQEMESAKRVAESLKKENEELRKELNDRQRDMEDSKKAQSMMQHRMTQQSEALDKKSADLQEAMMQCQTLRENIQSMNDTNAKLILFREETSKACDHQHEMELKDCEIENLKTEVDELKAFCKEREEREQRTVEEVVTELKKHLN